MSNEMSTPTEEGAAAAQPQADVDTLITQFRETLAIQSQLLEENSAQQELLKKVSAVAHKIPYAQLVYMMYEVNEHGTFPPEAFEFESEQQQQPTSTTDESAQDCALCQEEANYMDADGFEASSGENASNTCIHCIYIKMITGQTATSDVHHKDNNGYAGGAATEYMD